VGDEQEKRKPVASLHAVEHVVDVHFEAVHVGVEVVNLIEASHLIIVHVEVVT
jgi:hypothetical protein